MRTRDINAKTLSHLDNIWQGILDVKKEHGVGPGGTSISTNPGRPAATFIRSGKSRSLRRTVEKEASKCFRGFARMETIIKRTEALIEQEQENIK